MKRTATLTALVIAALLLVVTPTAFSQGAPPPSTQPAPTAADKVFEGSLTKVDTATKTISVKGMEGRETKEMSFKYDDSTQVLGGDKTVQGLSGKPGAQLKITYKEERGTNQASKIEIAETK